MSTQGAELSNRFVTRDVEIMSDETQVKISFYFIQRLVQLKRYNSFYFTASLSFIITHFILQNNRMDILECLSVLINENNSANDQTEGLTLDEHLLSDGTTLTAVTLPDGTQAFVANNFNDNG